MNLTTYLAGQGQVETIDRVTRMTLPSATQDLYSDAQVDDYGSGLSFRRLSRRSFPHRPPLRLSLRARFSHKTIAGTAGFGFWNHPVAPGGGFPALPRAIWFFYASPPSDMRLAIDVPGRGWKAATIDAARPTALAIAPLAPIVLLLDRSKRLYRRIWPGVQRALTIHEQMLPPSCMTGWHAYTIEWEVNRSRFYVDGQLVHEADQGPHGPLGFVAWIDNQYAVVTPTGRVRFGLVEVQQPQWLEIADVEIQTK
jgi:hypothetical protein